MEINLDNVTKIMFEDLLEIELEMNEGHEDKKKSSVQEMNSRLAEKIKEDITAQEVEEMVAHKLAQELHGVYG